MSAIRAVILDFDGVILESNDAKTQAFERVFSRFPEHAAAMMAYHRAHVSESRFLKFQHLVTTYLGRSSGDPLVADLAAEFSDAMLSQLTTCPTVPGALEFLDRVGARVPLFLASVTPQEELDLVLSRRGLAQHFARVYGCPPWTKVSAVADILAGLGGAAGVVFVGDSAGDQRAAIATGVEFIARESGLTFDVPPPPSGRDMHAVYALIECRLPQPAPSRT